MCVFLKKQEKEGEEEKCIFMCTEERVGPAWGKGRDLTGKVRKRTPERTAQVSRLGHKNMTARKVAHLQSAGIRCST